MTDDILNIILKNTNDRLEREVKGKNKEPNPLPRTNPTELMAFFGLWYTIGVTKQNKVELQDLWKINSPFHMAIFTAVMSRQRFEKLFHRIRFDDKSKRPQAFVNDKIAALREITDHFIKSCQQSFVPSAEVCVDERITPFRGRCCFKVYMSLKPHKYGIKIWVLADSKNYYIKKFEVYKVKLVEWQRKNKE